MPVTDFLSTLSLLFDVSYYFGIFLLTLVVVPAIIGGELGIRKGYISLLMKLFKWGTARIQREETNNKTIMVSGAEDIIEKEASINRMGSLSNCVDEPHKKFELDDVVYLIKSGVEAVIDDEVTKRFRAEELPSWNLLTRSNFHYHFISVRLSILWFCGFLLRYCILLPLRILITVFACTWLLATMLPLTVMKDSSFKKKMAYYVNVVGFRIICRAFSAVITYHDRENMPKSGGICVANHTTTLDAAVLMQDRPYAILGQIHGGFLGWLMRTMSKATKHVWFERSEVRDRQFVSKRIMEHVSDPNNFPVLLFPEGTCINNTSVMMFKKGSFEIPTTIYPVAIKYNPWFGDAYWNSSKHSMIQYLLVVMSSWAIVADVWYLPAMERNPEETAIEFASRVKSVIVRKGGLVDCAWDGQLKRMRVKESYLKQKQKELGELFAEDEEDFLQKTPLKKVRFNLDPKYSDCDHENLDDIEYDLQDEETHLRNDEDVDDLKEENFTLGSLRDEVEEEDSKNCEDGNPEDKDFLEEIDDTIDLSSKGVTVNEVIQRKTTTETPASTE